MNDEEIIKFIREIDSHVPKEKSKGKMVEFSRFSGLTEVALYANKEGYLRIAIELLKCSIEQTYPEADLNYMFKDSEIGIDHFAIDESQLDLFT